MDHTAHNKANAGMIRLLNDARGNIMPMAAIAMIAMAGMVGGGVDISRAYMVQNRLQNACDSGVLAGRRAINGDGFNAAAKAQADSYFETNFDETGEGTSGTVFTPVSTDGGNEVTGTATTTLKTVVMRLFGYNSMNLSVSCSASMSMGNSDVVMVLDTTGSMDWTVSGYYTSDNSQRRITYLRKAMKDFYDTVSTASAGGNARLRFGFVPYNTTVKVGRLLYDENPNYLVDSWNYHTRRPVYDTVKKEETVGWKNPVTTTSSGYTDVQQGDWYYLDGTRYRNDSQCQNARPADEAWANYGSVQSSDRTYVNANGQLVKETKTSQEQRRKQYECYAQNNNKRYVIVKTDKRFYEDVTYLTKDPIIETTTTQVFAGYQWIDYVYPTSTLKSFSPVTTDTGNGGTNVTSTWEGCIEERDTVSALRFSFSTADGITPDGALDLDIDTAPTSGDPATQWRPLWKNVTFPRNSNSYTGDCSVSPAQLLTEMTKDEFDAYADSLKAAGSTYHDIGMIWGARLSSPTGIFASNVTEAPTNGGSVSRHIIFMTDGEMSPTTSGYTAYGIEKLDKRVTGDGSNDQRNRHSSRFLAACQATKAKGIRIWVIAFGTELTSNLESCASADSAFNANSADKLNAAFQEIAKNVGELRVTQ